MPILTYLLTKTRAHVCKTQSIANDHPEFTISVEESPSWLGKTTKKVWSFLTIPIKKLFVFNFILALFEKNVLLTPKIKNTNLVALESVESLYHNIGLQINNKNVPIFTETWQLMIKHWYRFLRRFSADFVSIKYSSTLPAVRSDTSRHTVAKVYRWNVND